MLFPFFTIFLIFVVWLAVRYRSGDRKSQQLQEDFWENEAKANSAPAIDLDSIHYISIPLEKFPLGLCPEDEILQMESRLKELSEKRILNLTGKTNTELKATYGVKNLPAIMEIGENFDQLTVLLKDYASALIQRKHISEAVSVLEFGVGIGTDISQHYIMLGQCYHQLGKSDKIDYLIEQVNTRDLLLGPSIVRQLESMKTEYQPITSSEEEDFSL